MFPSLKKSTKQNGQVELLVIQDQLQELKAELLLQQEQHQEIVQNLKKQLEIEDQQQKVIKKELETLKTNLLETNSDQAVHKLNTELEQAQRELARSNTSCTQAKIDLEGLKGKLDVANNEHQEVIKDRQRLWEEYQKLESSSKANEEDRQNIIKDRQRLWEEYQKLDESRNFWRDKAEKLEKDHYTLNEQILLLQAEVSTDKKYILRNESLLKENHFILIQLRQAQDELTNLQESHQKLQNQNDSIRMKWKRLEKRFPNYTDYGGLELVQVDTVGLAPQILWKVTDYSRGDLALPEFYFVTTFQDGNVGIAIDASISALNIKGNHRIFYPNNVENSIELREMFFEFTQSEWDRATAAGAILEQLLTGENPLTKTSNEEFDISFWRSSLQTLISGLKKLPTILRYESVKLKRELINTDYEHLWLEIHGINFANQRLDKFEIRIGASLIETNGFSRFPKFEIPLIDGKTQPFKSWFAESHDDQGPKFELRFSLDKSVFDIATWLKLSKEDQNLLQILLFRLPIILNALSKEKISIRRPWDQWILFVNSALAVMQKQAALISKITAEVKEEKQNELSSRESTSGQIEKRVLQKSGKKSSVTILSKSANAKNLATKKTIKNSGTKQNIKKSAGR